MAHRVTDSTRNCPRMSRRLAPTDRRVTAMERKHYCRICHHEIAHLDAECPHCASRREPSGARPWLVLAAVVAAMILLFVGTEMLTDSFRETRDGRRQLHMRIRLMTRELEG